MSGATSAMVGVLAGGGASAVALAGGSASSIGSGTRSATVRLSNDGNLYHGDTGVFTAQYPWKVSGAVADYDVFCTVVSGSVSGTTGSWLNLATTRDWSVSDPTNDGSDVQAEITLQIRNASTLAVLATGDWSLSADRFS